MDRETRSSLLVLAAVVAFAALAWAARAWLGIEWSAESVRSLVARQGVWGPVVFVLLTGLRSFLLIPSQIMLVAAGLCFGTALGALYGGLGIVLSGSIAFAVARYAGREAMLARIPPNLHWALRAGGGRAGATALFLGTAYPVGPITAFHAGAGLTAMGIGAFLPTLAAASLVRAGLYTWFGSALVGGDGWKLAAAGALLLATLLLPLAHPRGRAWLRAHIAGPGEADPAPPDGSRPGSGRRAP